MKQIISNYAFDKNARTITFTDFTSISLNRVLLITNVTSNIIIYQFNTPALGGAVTGNILTLAYDTSAMANADKLQIMYDCATGDPRYDDASSGVAIQGAHMEFAGLSVNALNGDLVPSTDVSAYKWLSIQIQGTYAGTLSFQGSNDGINFVGIRLGNMNSPTASSDGSTTGTGIWNGPVTFRYLRIRMTAFTSGTATGVLELYSLPTQLTQFGVHANQTGTWTVQPGNTANTTPWLVNPVGAGSLSTTQVSVGTSATQLVATRTNRKAVVVTNAGTTDVFVGGGSVSTVNGLLLAGTKGASLTLETTAAVSAIVATGTQVVSVLEVF